MAAFEDIALLQFQARLASGVEIRNTLHFRRNPSAGDVDATWLTAWVNDSNTTTLLNKWAAMVPTTGVVTGLLARAEHDPLNPSADRDEAFRDAFIAGGHGQAGTAAPAELCPLLKLSGDLAGRRYRGRIWLPPMTQTSTVSGENLLGGTTYETVKNAFATDLAKTMYTSGAGHYGGQWNDCDLIVFSRRGRSLDETYYARCTSIAGPARLHWLRSRAPRG